MRKQRTLKHALSTFYNVFPGTPLSRAENSFRRPVKGERREGGGGGRIKSKGKKSRDSMADRKRGGVGA